jgi:hypothetical protein
MRRIAIMLFGLVLAGTAAGDETKPDSRYAVQPSDDGFIRLDTQTGAVSHCGRREGVWFCEKLVEDQTALERQIDALTARVDALSKEVDALASRPLGASPAPAQVAESPDFTTKLIRRFHVLIRRMKGSDAGS